MDIATCAIRLSHERTMAAGLTAQFQQNDFLRDAPSVSFDWVFEHTLFCAIDPGEHYRHSHSDSDRNADTNSTAYSHSAAVWVSYSDPSKWLDAAIGR